MNLISYVETFEDYQILKKNGFSKFIISSKTFNRFSKLTEIEVNQLAQNIKNDNSTFEISFEWDVLLTEDQFKKSVLKISEIDFSVFDSIRVQEAGAVYWCYHNIKNIRLDLILETGNHNLRAVKAWHTFLNYRLGKIVLSNELSREQLRHYCEQMNIPFEVLVFGRILLFYSPRSLLAPLVDVKKEYIETFGTSEESPHKGFPLIENSHGTFMFNVKDLSLLDNLDDLKEIGVKVIRYDFRFDQMIQHCDQVISYKKKSADGILPGDRPYIKGFYNVNKTDILFSKLKNSRVARVDQHYLGEVLDVEKSGFLTIKIMKDINILGPIDLKLITPEGKLKEINASKFLNLKKEVVTKFINEDLVLIPYVSGIIAKTQVYINKK